MKVGDILILLIRKTGVQFSVRGGIPVSDASVLFFFFLLACGLVKTLCHIHHLEQAFDLHYFSILVSQNE